MCKGLGVKLGRSFWKKSMQLGFRVWPCPTAVLFSSQNKTTSLSFPVSFVSCFLIKKLSKMALHVSSLERIFFASLLCLCVFVLLLVEAIFFFDLKHLHHRQLLLRLLATSSSPLCILHLLVACLPPSHLFCLFVACRLLATPTYYMLPICLLLIASFACHAYFHLLTYFYHCHLLASMSWCRYQTPIPLFHHLFICFELQAFPLAWYFPFTCLCKRYNIGGVCINL